MYWFIEGMSFIKKSLFFVLVLLCPASLFSQQNKDSAKLIVKEKSQINALAVSAESSLLLEATGNSVVLWNAVTLQKLHTFTGFSSPVTQIKFNKNSDLFLTVAQDNTVSVYSLSDYKEIFSLPSYVNGKSIGASFSADGRSVFASTDGVNVDSYFLLLYTRDFISQNICSHGDTVYSIDVNKNNFMITAGLDEMIQIYDIKNGLSLYSIPVYTADFFPAVFSADGNSFVCAESEDTLTLRDLNGNVLLRISDDDLFTQKISFSSDGKYLAALLQNGAVRIFDLRTGFADSTLDVPVTGAASGSADDADGLLDSVCDIQFADGSNAVFVCTAGGLLYRCAVGDSADGLKAPPQAVSVAQRDSLGEETDGSAKQADSAQESVASANDAVSSADTVPSDATGPRAAPPAATSRGKKASSKKGNTFSENLNGNLPSSTFFIGAGYTIIPSQLYIGDFDLDLSFQKYFSDLHASFGFDLNGGFALPGEKFPYKYMLLDGKYTEAPWLYTIKPSVTVGVQAISKNGNRIFFDVLAGPSIRFIWNNSVKGCIITKPVYSYNIGLSAGVDFHGLTLKACLAYNMQVEFQPSAQAGYTVKFFKKEVE